MKEGIGAAANFYLTPVGKPYPAPPFAPTIEAVVNVTEPRYTVDAAGELVRQRAADQVRFHTTPDGLRMLAGHFNEWADAAEKMAAEVPAPEAGPKAKE
jgi:hypothetical protein